MFLKCKMYFIHYIIGQERLSDLSILQIENLILASIDVDDIIAEFASLKCRRKVF